MIYSAVVSYQCDKCLRTPGDQPSRHPMSFACLCYERTEGGSSGLVSEDCEDSIKYHAKIHPTRVGGLSKLRHTWTCDYCGAVNNDTFVPELPVRKFASAILIGGTE